jgi:hypothetical protein
MKEEMLFLNIIILDIIPTKSSSDQIQSLR